MSAICPECDSPIDVDEFDVDIGDELTCSECGSFLRVSNDSPLEFDVADDDDDEEDDEEDDEKEEEAPAEEEEDLDDTDDDDERIDEDE